MATTASPSVAPPVVLSHRARMAVLGATLLGLFLASLDQTIVSTARVALGMVELHLPDVDSLKGKRHVLKGLKERVRARFECSVAEVDHQDSWQRATLAVAYVSGDARHANEVVSKAMDFIEDHVEGRVLDTSVEIL